MGLPPRSARAFPGRRVEANRAGMTTVKLTRAEFQAPPDLFDFLGGLELARLFLEHHRNIVADRKSEAVSFAHQLGLRLAMDERPLAHRADQEVKQAPGHQHVPA